MSIQIPYLNYERTNPIFIPINQQLSKNNRIIGISSHIPSPPFRSSHRRSMYHKLISLGIKRRRRFQPSNVRTMSKLSLSVATADPEIAT